MNNALQLLAQQSRPAPLALSALLDDIQAPNTLIQNIHEHSGFVQQGDAFLCLPRTAAQQQQYIQHALDAGAAAVLIVGAKQEDLHTHCYALADMDAAGALLRRWFRTEHAHPTCIGTTGTDGKTSITWMLREILERLHGDIWSSGTLGWMLDKHDIRDLGNTTPSLLNNHRLLAAAHQHKASALVMEVSSHGIAQERIAGIPFQSAIWSSIGHDHIEDHGNYENYLHTKAGFIRHVVAQGGIAICNADHADIRSQVPASASVFWYAHQRYSDPVHLRWQQIDQHSMEITYEHRSLRIDHIPAGDFHAENLAAATLLLCKQWQLPFDDVPFVLRGLSTPLGRMQAVHAGDWTAYIDYAHTPEGLERSLKTAGQWTQGRLLVVFGCGGNRDAQKRPLMGAAAATYAQEIWLTNDNPRHENPGRIIQDIQTGIPHHAVVHVQPDRERAIADAIASLSPNDTLLIAGKGHEQYMETAGIRSNWSDIAVTKKYLEQKAQCI